MHNEVFIVYAADGDPNNDVFKYVINDGTPHDKFCLIREIR